MVQLHRCQRQQAPCRQADEDHQEKRIPVCRQQKGAEKRARAETDEKAGAGDPELAELIPEKTLHQGENRTEAQCQDADLVAQGIENSLRVSHRRHLFFIRTPRRPSVPSPKGRLPIPPSARPAASG